MHDVKLNLIRLKSFPKVSYISQKMYTLASWKTETKMLSFWRGRPWGLPSLYPMTSSPYYLLSLRWSCGIIPANEIQAENSSCNFQQSFHSPDEREKSACVSYHALPCFLLSSWNTGVMSGEEAAIRGPWGEPLAKDGTPRVEDPEPLMVSSNIFPNLDWLPLNL